MTTTPASDEIEPIIRRFFEENFELLRLEGGRTLAPEVKQAALDQVLLYWRKLQDVATRITDTEVKLNLPEQKTPKNRKFGIEGVVDIVREEGRTTMYDIKTHDLEAIRGNLELYEQQLNVYAHIWRHLRGQELDKTAIISTNFPRAVKEALASDLPGHLEYELARWDPIVPIPFDEDRLAETIEHFGEVVDAIEDGEFDPAPLEKLYSKQPGMKSIYATQVCVNCDARYSCDSYRAYAQQTKRVAERAFSVYLADTSSDIDLTDRIVAGLDVASTATDIDV